MKKHHPLLILFIYLAIGLFCVYSLRQLEFDYNFENFFPRHNKELDFYLLFRNIFENDNDYLLIAMRDPAHPSGLFNPSFLKEAQKLHNRLEQLPYIRHVTSLINAKYWIISPLGHPQAIRYLHPQDSAALIRDSLRLRKTEEFTGMLMSDDARSLCFIVRNKEIITKKESDSLLAQLELLLQQFHRYPVYWTGKIRAQKIYLDKIHHQLIRFTIAGAILVILLLWFFFRNPVAVLAPFLILVISISITLSLMPWMGKKIDILGSLIPLILFIVGTSDAVHFLNKFYHLLQQNHAVDKAITLTYTYLRLPLFLTSFTTAVGFLSLLNLPIKPIRDFGLFASMGVMVAYGVTVTLLPVLLKKFPLHNVASYKARTIIPPSVLHKTAGFAFRYRFSILIAGLILFITGLYVFPKIKINYFLLEDLPHRHPLKQDVLFFEHHFAGARPFEMVIKPASPLPASCSTLQQIDQIEQYLNDSLHIRSLISVTAVFKSIVRAMHGGNFQHYRLPADEEECRQAWHYFHFLRSRPEMKWLLHEKYPLYRVSGKMHDIGSYAALKQEKKLRQFLDSLATHSQPFSYTITGSALLIDRNNQLMTQNTRQGLLLAFIIIALTMVLLFRNLKMMLVSLLPNIIPLCLLVVAFYISGHDFNISSSVVFIVGFGIAVDDTIHLLSRFLIEKRKTSPAQAISIALTETGHSMILTTLILLAGFITLIFSDFTSTYRLGLYLSLTLFVALLLDLIFLPALLFLSFGRNMHRYHDGHHQH